MSFLLALWMTIAAGARAQVPVITAITSPRQVVAKGQSLTLSVTATGATSYQWKRSGRPISGATNASYTITSASPLVDNGWYQAVAINGSGSTTSAVVFVHVNIVSAQVWAWGPGVIGQTTVPAGLSNLTGVVSGPFDILALKADGTVVAWGENSFGQSIVPAGLSDVVGLAAGYTCSLALKSDGTITAWGTVQWPTPPVATNIVAIAASTGHNLALKSDDTVVAWGEDYHGKSTVPPGLTEVIAVAAGASHSIALKADGTVVVWGDNQLGQTNVPASLSGVVAIAAGPYYCVALKGDGTIAAWGNGLSLPLPSGVAAVASGTGSFSLVLEMDGTVELLGSNPLGLLNVPPYLATVTAFGSGAYHAVALRDAAGDTMPAITLQPTNLTANIGGAEIFSVAASGFPSSRFQWFRNGELIAGATDSALTLINLQVSHAGNYTVTATNLVGSVTSNAGTLSGPNPPPTVTTQPQATTVTVGQTANLSVAASGIGPLTYQWRRNGMIIAGATNATFALPGASRTDADFYDAVVADGLSLGFSAPAKLSVAPAGYPEKIYLPATSRTLFARDNASVQRVWPLGDGRFYVAGSLAAANNTPTAGLARFNADGAVDPTFAVAGTFTTVNDLVVQPDGRIVIGGEFSQIDGQLRQNFARLHPDGKLDTGFAVSGFSGPVQALARLPDGRLLVGGAFTSYQGLSAGTVSRACVARVNADGTLDLGFNPGAGQEVLSFAVQSDGKYLVGGRFATIAGQPRSRLARLNADGTLDSSFTVGSGPSDAVRVIRGLTDGRMIVGGAFTTYNGSEAGRIARLSSTGTFDATFLSAVGFDGEVRDLVLLTDGRLVAGGSFMSYGFFPNFGYARLSANGVIDEVFSLHAVGGAVHAIGLQGDGRFLLGGAFSTIGPAARSRAVRLHANGTVDSSFVPQLLGEGQVNACLLLPGGRMLVGGHFSHVNGVALAGPNLARLQADGSLDTAFNSGTGANDQVRALLRQADGRIVIGGEFTLFAGSSKLRLARITVDGTLDAMFPSGGNGMDGPVMGLDSVPGGQLVAVGSFTQANGVARKHVARLSANGAVDLGFDPGAGPLSGPSDVAVAPDGKIYIAGVFPSVGAHATNRIARLNTNGSVDTGFVSSNSLFEYPYSLAVRPDGKLVVGGYQVGAAPFPGHVALLNSTGARDPSFNGTGSVSFPGPVTSVHLQEDGRILVSGAFPGSYARLSASGIRETGFVVAGVERGGFAFSVRDDGQLFLGGSTSRGAGFTSTGTASAISTPPLNQTASAGGSATFSITASGTPAPSYQWTFNGAPIAGATASALTLTNVTPANVGTYAVSVTNGFGSVNSTPVTLSGSEPVPTITAQPASFTATAGQPATLSVTASGGGSLTYQWSRDGFPISGATASSHTFTASRADEGEFVVRIANGLSIVTSLPAALRVAPAQTIDLLAPDMSFAPVLENPAAAVVNAQIVLPDGKILMAGNITRIGGVVRTHVARLHPNGTLDATFVPPVLDAEVRAMVRQPDGKIIIGGYFTRVGSTKMSRVARLNADGSFDPSFNPGASSFSDVVHALALQADGRVVVGGKFVFTAAGSVSMPHLVRLNPDGSRDAGFPTVFDTGSAQIVRGLALQSDGRVVVVGDFTAPRNSVLRLTPNGTVDPTFNSGTAPNGAVERVVVSKHASTAGRIFLAGAFSSFNGNTHFNVVRLQGDGIVDPTFTAPVSFSGNFFRAFAETSDGRLLAALASTLWRLNSNGTVETSVGVQGVQSLEPDAAGGALVAADFPPAGSPSSSQLGFATLAANTTLSAPVYPGALGPGSAIQAAQVPGGKLLVGGAFSHVNGVPRNHLARLHADGSVDSAFDAMLPFESSSNAGRFALQGDGRLVVLTNSSLLRRNIDGSADNSFPVRPIFYGAHTVDTAGRTLASNNGFSFNPLGILPDRFGVARLVDGVDDGLFTAATNSTVSRIVATTGGQYYVAGIFSTVNGVSRNRVARIGGNGSLDPGFVPPTSAFGTPVAMTPQPDGKLLVGFSTTAISPSLQRLNTDGAADTAFNSNAFFPRPGSPSTMAATGAILLLPAGRILRGGSSISITSMEDGPGLLSRHAATGQRDTSFRIGNVNATLASIRQILLQDDGKLLLVGSGFSAVGEARYGLMRLEAAFAPTISAQPLSQAAPVGGNVTLAVQAAGTAPLTYQWSKNGALLSNATNATLSFATLSAADGGAYTVTVTSAVGTIVSDGATLTVLTSVAPSIIVQPRSQSVSLQQSFTLTVGVAGTAPFSYQWRKDSAPISGATNAAFTVSSAQASDAGAYSVVVTNVFGDTTSSDATITVVAAGVAASHALVEAGYGAGDPVTITNTIMHAGTITALRWSVLLPPGWSFVAAGGNVGNTTGPGTGQTDLLEWTWTTIAASPVTFTYTLHVPAGTTGDQQLAALMVLRQGGPELEFLAKPDPLIVSPLTHAGDVNRNYKISLVELTRVIELYNTRTGTTRTGCYKVDPVGEDGFAPEPARSGTAVVALTKYHSGDPNRDGRLSLFELTRMIELYNTRSGTTRTGQYHVQAGTEDGFAPGP